MPSGRVDQTDTTDFCLSCNPESQKQGVTDLGFIIPFSSPDPRTTPSIREPPSQRPSLRLGTKIELNVKRSEMAAQMPRALASARGIDFV